MTGKPVHIDDTETLRRFVRSMSAARGSYTPSTLPTAETKPSTSASVAVGSTAGTEVITLGTTPSNTSPMSLERDHGTYASWSPEEHPAPSPHVAGLRVPQNTPHTSPSSPCMFPSKPQGSSDIELPGTFVGETIYNYVQGIKGVPLSE